MSCLISYIYADTQASKALKILINRELGRLFFLIDI